MNDNPRSDIHVQYQNKKGEQTGEYYMPGDGICKFLANNYLMWNGTDWINEGLFEEEIAITNMMLAGF